MSHKQIGTVLKVLTLIMALLGLLLYLYAIPYAGKILLKNNGLNYYVWLSLYLLTAFPCYFVLVKVFQIGNNFVAEKVFTKENEECFESIFKATMADVILLLLLTIVYSLIGFRNPLFIILKLLVCFVGFSFGFLIKVIAEMVERAVKLQEENDLTI